MQRGVAECLAGVRHGDVVSDAFCNRTADTSSISLNERMMPLQSIFITFRIKSGSEKA